MNEFMTELFPWLLIITSLTVFADSKCKREIKQRKEASQIHKRALRNA